MIWIAAHKTMLIAIGAAFSQFCTTVQHELSNHPEVKVPKLIALILKWGAYIAPPQEKGLIGRLSVPYLHVPHKSPATPPPIPLAALLLFLLPLHGCFQYCQTPANAKTVQCIAENELVKCGPQTFELIAFAIPYLVTQDWNGLFAELAAQWPAGQQIARCVIDNIDTKVAKLYGMNSDPYMRFKAKRTLFEMSRK